MTLLPITLQAVDETRPCFGRSLDEAVMGQVRNHNVLTLQACIPPTFEERLVVRADRA